MFQVSISPHLKDTSSTKLLMYSVLIALSPALLISVYLFRMPALIVLGSSALAAIVTEALINIIRKKKLTIFDGSALLTGLLMASTIPPTTPWWVAALGASFAIAVVKQAFGGLGMNIFNPALIGRAFIVASYPVILTTWVSPLNGISTATPLGLLGESGKQAALQSVSYLDSFLGATAGSVAETSALALLLGGLFLIIRKVIDWRIPVFCIGTVAVMAALLGQDILFHLLNGGLILGAFFMATDYVTSPVTPWGRIVFGIGIGFMVMIIRLYGGYPEGVCYAILLMNAFTPLLDKIRFQKDVFL